MVLLDLYLILALAVLAAGIAINDHFLAASARQTVKVKEIKE